MPNLLEDLWYTRRFFRNTLGAVGSLAGTKERSPGEGTVKEYLPPGSLQAGRRRPKR